jgi:hypothetical protein
MSYSISIKLTKESLSFLINLNKIDWDQLVYPQNPQFCFCGVMTSYGPKNSFGFDYSLLGSEQRVALYNFVQKLSERCGQKGFYYYDEQKTNEKLDIDVVWDKGFISFDLYNKWVRFFDDIMKQI